MKILVITGTQLQKMSRLNKALNKSKIVHGRTIYYQSAVDPSLEIDYKWLGLIEQSKLDFYQNKADILIVHGGTGSLMRALNLGKRVLAVPRLSSYGEHVNDHQEDLIKLLSDNKCVISWNESDIFDEKLAESLSYDTKPYPFHENKKLLLEELLIDSKNVIYEV